MLLAGFCFFTHARPAPLVSIDTHDAFFNAIAKHCGQAFLGKVIVDTAPSAAFDAPLVMHVRVCNQRQLQVPFHVGDDASRTWLITKTGSGLNLKHDHRKADGSDDQLTMYGGHTVDAGSKTTQAFPADVYSKQLFIKLGYDASVGNTWEMSINDNTFVYRLVRENREFAVSFDLSQAINLPVVPWGYE
ncbi:MAG: hypothetical protein WA981_10165 [Glaciecola sp.]